MSKTYQASYTKQTKRSNKFIKQSLRTQQYDVLESLPTKQKIKPRRGER